MADSSPRVRVIENGQIRTLLIGRIQQSSMYLDSPFDTDFDYPGYLHLTLTVVPSATRTLMIGLGGGSAVKRMWRDYPKMRIDAVEIDAEVVEIARSHFALPDDDRIRVHVADGRAFLERSADVYDIIVVDAFVEDQVPLPLTTEEFHRLALSRMAPDSVLAYNFHGSVTGDRSKPFRRLHKTLKTSFRHVWAFPVGLSAGEGPGEHREIIIIATNAGIATAELLERVRDRVGGLVTVPGFHLFGEDLYQGGIRTGDVSTICDPPGYTHS